MKTAILICAVTAIALSDMFVRGIEYLDAHPELYPLIIWPAATGVVSFAQDRIKRFAPRLWAFLQRSGLDLLGLLRMLFPKVFPPSQPPPPPVDLPPTFPTTPPSAGGPMARVALAFDTTLRRAALRRMLPPFACILLAGCVPILGCAGGAGQADRAITTIIEAVPLVDEQMHRAYDRELEACSDVPCVDRVESEWRPFFATMQTIRDAWCLVAPEAEGC
ncbi:MAG: hypothetical protein HOW73_45460 [Polyangiaceae bacterium]|nr:hypothetical protein [Polyangiaceae bacterium]